MKHPDAWLIAVIFAVWAALAVMYATIPMLHMPHAIRVWGLGALLFLGLAGVVWAVERAGRARRARRTN